MDAMDLDGREFRDAVLAPNFLHARSRLPCRAADGHG
jgi:hypothetical protein